MSRRPRTSTPPSMAQQLRLLWRYLLWRHLLWRHLLWRYLLWVYSRVADDGPLLGHRGAILVAAAQVDLRG